MGALDLANFALLLVVMKGSHWYPEYVTCRKCLWTYVVNELNCSCLPIFWWSQLFWFHSVMQAVSGQVPVNPIPCIRPNYKKYCLLGQLGMIFITNIDRNNINWHTFFVCLFFSEDYRGFLCTQLVKQVVYKVYLYLCDLFLEQLITNCVVSQTKVILSYPVL